MEAKEYLKRFKEKTLADRMWRDDALVVQKWDFASVNNGHSPGGKARPFDGRIRWFKSNMPSFHYS